MGQWRVGTSTHPQSTNKISLMLHNQIKMDQNMSGISAWLWYLKFRDTDQRLNSTGLVMFPKVSIMAKLCRHVH